MVKCTIALYQKPEGGSCLPTRVSSSISSNCLTCTVKWSVLRTPVPFSPLQVPDPPLGGRSGESSLRFGSNGSASSSSRHLQSSASSSCPICQQAHLSGMFLWPQGLLTVVNGLGSSKTYRLFSICRLIC